MEYSMNRLTKLAGISPRSLRYYDEIGLLKPARVADSGYRFYGQAQVDALQQILLYREMGFSLQEIKRLLSSPDFNRAQAFESHLTSLQEKRERLDRLIENVRKSLAEMKGEIKMSDQEKFVGFKQKLIVENEQRYGKEIRETYGEEAVKAAHDRIGKLSQEVYDHAERLRLDFEQQLLAAFETGDPAGALAQQACDLHRQWLCVYSPHYSKEYHKGLADMYVADQRFRVNYDKLAPGCTEFLRDAIHIYCG